MQILHPPRRLRTRPSPCKAATTILHVTVVAFLVGSPVAMAKDESPQALLERHRCTICHDAAETKAGPSWSAIAAAHRGDAKAAQKLTAVIRKGKHGEALWPMPPSTVPRAEARAMVREILRH